MKYDVIGFARAELEKYLGILNVSADVKLGLFSDFGLHIEVENPKYDDAIAISVKDRVGYVAGSNERSVLIGVYRLLSEWGIRWIRPGKNGTYYPKACDAHDISLTEKAYRRHRTMCIEGAVSLENVLDMVEWLPKAGFNGYFIQFHDAFIFFDRWYAHRGSTVKQPEPFDYDTSLRYVNIVIKEVKRRGLLLQRMGHGWTCDPFGVTNHGWDPVDPAEIPDSYREVCALVDGKRDVWMNIPGATQICLSKKYARDTVKAGVIRYLKENPDTDVLHFWMGDYYNNTCECEECRKLTASDAYVQLINEVTDEIKREGLDTMLVITCYYNYANAPTTYRIKHPELVTLMLAPITRTFSQPFPCEYRIKQAPAYKINSFGLPSSVDEILSYLYEWKQCFSGNAVDFDYHLMWDYVVDAGAEGMARVLYEDIRSFDSLGIDGYISCQLQRNTFPTSIAMTVMGKTLWNREVSFDEVKRELYEASFGVDAAERMGTYFATLSRGFDIGAMRSQRPMENEEKIRNMRDALRAMEEIAPFIEAHLDDEDPCRRECWMLADMNRRIYSLIGQSVLVRLEEGDLEKAEKLRLEAVQFAYENEDVMQGAFDCFFFDRKSKSRFNLESAAAFKDF